MSVIDRIHGFRARSLLLPMAVIALTACDAPPRDSAGTLDRVRGQTLRVGVVDNPPWTIIDGAGRVEGVEAGLISEWAGALGARIVWSRDAEADLVDALHRRELDVLTAGLVTDTPYRSRVALSRPYLEIEDSRGKMRKRVVAVIPGENALLFSLDRFLARQDEGDLRARVHELRASTVAP